MQNTPQSTLTSQNTQAHNHAQSHSKQSLLAKLYRVFYSFKVILPLIFFYALSCAVATFIENDYGTSAAHTIVYGSWWFMLLHLYLVLALVASFIHSQALKRKKYASLLLHSSFIVIIIGAGITRYFGTEGLMFVKEGTQSSEYYSNDNFINIAALNEQWEKDYAKIPANINVFKTFFNEKKIHTSVEIFHKPLEIISQEVSALADMQTNKNAPMLLRLQATYNGETKSIELIGGNGVSYERNPVRLEIGGMKMSFHWGSSKVELPFGLRLLEFEKQTYAGTDNPSSYASQVEVIDSDGKVIKPFRIFMNNVLDFHGYRFYQSDYAYNEEENRYTSVLSVNNDPGKIPTYIGYTMLILGVLWLLFDKNGRFMQLARFLSKQNSSTLAVLFTLGVLSSYPLYAQNTFQNIQPHTTAPQTLESNAAQTPLSTNPQNLNPQNPNPQNKIERDPQALLALLAAMLPQDATQEQKQAFLYALSDLAKDPSTIPQERKEERLKLLKQHSAEFANRLSRIQVQDYYGRIQPLDTMALDILHKIAQKDSFQGLSAMQTLIGLMVLQGDFATSDIITTKTKQLRKILGVDSGKQVSFMDMYDTATGESKLHNYFVDVMQKKESDWNVFDKDVRKVTESFEIIKSVQSLMFLRIFPDPQTKRWFSPLELSFMQAQGEIDKERFDSLAVMTESLLLSIVVGITTNSWQASYDVLQALESYQIRNGGEDYISANRIEWEIWLNHYNVFEMLTLPYLLLGLCGFIIVLVAIYRDKPISRVVYRVFFSLSVLCVLAHTLGLIARWYVSGHSPWSNAYESMIYIAWASGIAGVVFFPRFVLALCATSFFAGVSLFVAHLGYMDPQIQNLVPVLKSYWLNIHVSVITAGYGFLGLCLVLGVFSLVLFALRSEKKASIDKAILSVGAINEMAMMLGLFMLTIGNFLGAIWANESWGRYWGWDAKETWALISIGVYAIVLHLRFLGLKYMPFIFAASSVVAFYSILMTYFGVNYYLTGKHSYAAGDPVPVPWSVYVFVIFTLALIIIASFKKSLPAPNLSSPSPKE